MIILPFTVTGREEHRVLGEGMLDLRAIALDGTGGIHCADPRNHPGYCASSSNVPPRSLRCERTSMGEVALRQGELDVVLLAPAALGSARAADASGDADGAIRQYRRFLGFLVWLRH